VIRHQNFPRTDLEKLLPGGVKFGSYPGYEGYRTATGKGAIARCEVELSYTGDRNKLEAEVIYASDLYRPETIEQLLKHHEQLLLEMMQNSQSRLSELTILTDTDRRRLFIDFNQTKRDIDFNKNFLTRWDEQVKKSPDSIACYDSFGSWRYREIAVASNAIASTLYSRGVKPGDIIGLCMERGASLLSAMFAIWRSGAAYVPLDPAYPESYLKQITNDAQPKLIIGTREHLNKLGFNEAICCIIDAKLPLLPDTTTVPSTAPITPDSLAYLMYTSGSTGIPKGARVPHRQLTNWLSGLELNYPFTADEVIAQKTTIAFAVSVKEIFAGLLNGCATVFIDTESVKDPVLFVDALRKYKATRVNLVPSHMMAVLSYMKKEKIDLPSLQLCTTAGEPLTVEMIMLCRSVLPHMRLINNYGCTELNDICYYDTTGFDAAQQGFAPVGKPIQNTQLYVLDRYARPVPLGVPGEVHVATTGMALGYHNLDDLNKERFIQNPFSREYGGILYNTGDVVRYLQDGNLEFLGRWDFQVKIRGFRVDVRHVEKVMGEFEGMGVRAVVGENGQLNAFYIQQPGTTINIGNLREFLQQKLPPYMVPTAFIALTEMPKLPNGKLNRRALKVSTGTIQQSDTYEAPSTQIEKKLAELWAEVLEIPEDRVGKRSHFFELGGHSLSATRLIARVKEQLGIEVGLSLVFEYPRLNDLAQHLSTSTKSQDDDDSIIITSQIKNSKKRHSSPPGLLENKTILVTGGSRGIGRSAVRLLASHGASVAINYLKNSDQAMAVKDIIDEDGGVAEIFQGDTTNPDQVNDLVNNVRNRFGKIDVLVSNAAIGFAMAPFLQSNWGDFERKLSNELKSFYLLCQAVVPDMIEQKNGSIIAVSSTMSKSVQPGYCAHGAAKAALDSFVRSLAIELGPEGIRVNTVAPGLTITDATAPMAVHIKETAATRCPLRRNGLPRDIAGAILFLASDLSQFMTGTYLPVDGGYTML
jgi:amino acid adenylation domain-containing protein